MRQGEIWANQTEWAGCLAFRTTLSLFEQNCFNPHGAQAGEQKCRAKSPASDLAVYLLRRLVKPQFLEHARKLLVADISSNHLGFYQFFRGVLPHLVGRTLLRTPAWRRVHYHSSVLKSALLILYSPLFMAIFGRIRPIAFRARYTFSVGQFIEDKVLNKTLGTAPRAEQVAVIALVTHDTSILLLSFRGAK